MGVSELTASAAALSNLRVDDQVASTTPRKATSIVNRAGEGSTPYLQSHANSLVAWQLLDSEAIDRAKQEGKLIFMHIGFKACHYCRLMAVESFTNSECASVLNESFVPILIDRDERPDLDTIYMNYVQAVSNVGGWPLSLFLTPELEPVFGGTYWPGPEASRRGQNDNEEESLDFLTIIKKVQNIWKDQEARCRKEASEIVNQLRDFAAEGTLGTRAIMPSQNIVPAGWATPAPTETPVVKDKEGTLTSELDVDQLEEAFTHIAGTFDPVYGGFGLAPKFLTPPKLSFLLHLEHFPRAVQDVVGEAECVHATHMVLDTLRKIRDGALHDHVGKTGFARCSVTPDWSIPHFEKLVADNALLSSLYLDAWNIGGGKDDSEFYDVVIELAEYLSSPPIASPEGFFASSEAADSHLRKGDKEIREGAYYLWTRREFDSVVEAAEKNASPVAAAYFNVLEDGNVDEIHDPSDDFINQNTLRVVKTFNELSSQFNLPVETVKRYVETAKRALRVRRETERVRPELDTKSVTAWSGLVISSLACTGAALKTLKPELSKKYIDTASKGAEAIRKFLWDSERKTLYRIWSSGARHTKGFADDYAFMIRGLLDLFIATGDEGHIEFADSLQKSQISYFHDDAGGFYTTSASSSHTILRLKDGMDTSLPSTNAASVANLFKLGDLLKDDKFTNMARQTINAFEVEMLQHPWLFPGLLHGVVFARLGLPEGDEMDLKYRATRTQA